MKNTLIRMAALAATLSLLTACLPDESNTGNTPAPSTATTIKVTNMQGGTTDITGVWVAGCFIDTYSDVKFIEEYRDENNYKITEYTYTTTDSSCGGTTTVAGTRSGSFIIDADVTVTGWADGTTSIAPPTAQNGVTTLPTTPIVAVIKVTFSTATGTFSPLPTAPITIMSAVDATDTSNLAFYPIYDDVAGNLVVDGSDKFTKQ